MRITHTELLQYMKRLGYDVNYSGMCYGFIYMAVQAILADDIETYNQRMLELKSIPPEKIKDEINKIRLKLSDKNPLSPQDRIAALTEREVMILSIPAFFDGVALHFDPETYPQYFSEPISSIQNAERTFPLVLPKTLTVSEEIVVEDGKKSLIEKVNVEKLTTFTGIYNKAELTTFFKTIRESLAENLYLLPIALTLTSSRHIVCVGYNPRKNVWQWIDSGDAEEIASDAKIAEMVMASLTKNQITTFLTEVYSIKVTHDLLLRVKETLLNKKDWQTLHAVTHEKAERLNSYGASWLYMAAHDGRVDTVSELLRNGANQNQKTTDSGLTPLLRAAYNGHTDIMRILLDAGATLNQTMTGTGATEISLAAEEGHHEAIQLLLDRGGDPSIPLTDTLGSPLHFTAKGGHIEALEVLLKTRINKDAKCSYETYTILRAANQNQIKNNLTALIKKNHKGKLPENIRGLTALHLAALRGHSQIVKKLLESNATPMKASGMTPRDLALVMEHQEIVEMLDNHDIKNRLEEARKPGGALNEYQDRTALLERLSDGTSYTQKNISEFLKLDNLATQLLLLIQSNQSTKNPSEISALEDLRYIVIAAYKKYSTLNGDQIDNIMRTLAFQSQAILLANFKPLPVLGQFSLFRNHLYKDVENIFQEQNVSFTL